jgi:SNF2 family DNA or RNA helicase
MLYNEIEIPFTPQQKDVYEEIRKEMLYEYDEGLITAVNAGVKLLKLMQVSAGAIRNSEGNILLLDDKPRMDYLEETLEEMGKNRKLIIFSTFRASIEKLHKHFDKLKFKTAIINGDTPQNTRGELVRQFQDEDLEVFILQPKSMSHGVTLTASNTVVWQSLNPSGETFQQANARISRIGQERKQYVGLPYSSSVEKKMITLLKNKEIQSSNVLELFKDI